MFSRRFLLARVLQALLALLGVATMVFFVARLTGDPATVFLPLHATPEDYARLREAWGLDQPLYVQYVTFLGNAIRGDFGVSIVAPGRDALQVVMVRLPATLVLGIVALTWAVVLGVPLGILSAVYRGGPIDSSARTFAAFGQAIPSFWVGIVLMWIVAVELRWLPASGRGDWRNLVLPAIALGLYPFAAVVRLMRSSMIEVLNRPYLLLAESKGLSRFRIICMHAFKNAAAVPLTYFGIIIGIVLTGSIAVETVFGWPGIGRLAITAVQARDFATIQALTIVIAVVYLSVNLIVDVMYGVLDPRVQSKGGR